MIIKMNNVNINPHGGNLYKASEKYGINPHDFLDFSANINPFGVPGKLREIIVSNIDNLVNYPDPDCSILKSQISKKLDISKDNIIIGNGASEIIFLLFDILRPKRVLIPAPAFSEYAKAAKRYGAHIKYFELKESEEFKLNIDDFILEMENGVEAVLLCNPNNPTSTLLQKSGLQRIIAFAKEKKITVIVDEAFIELTEEAGANSIVQYVEKYDNLFIIRAFTKLFAIPGLRLGYGIGSHQLIKKMWDMKMPWSVNSIAICVGEYLDFDEEYLDMTSSWIKEEKKWFYNELKQIEDIKVFEPQTNFVLVKLLKDKATVGNLYNFMASNGILIRDASNFEFLNEKFFRLAIKDRASNIKLLDVLKEALVPSIA
jgi:threonine-phosphate decarboxylase